jgi:hypothetical protein
MRIFLRIVHSTLYEKNIYQDKRWGYAPTSHNSPVHASPPVWGGGWGLADGAANEE